jgi:hypothetical protein
MGSLCLLKPRSKPLDSLKTFRHRCGPQRQRRGLSCHRAREPDNTAIVLLEIVSAEHALRREGKDGSRQVRPVQFEHVRMARAAEPPTRVNSGEKCRRSFLRIAIQI